MAHPTQLDNYFKDCFDRQAAIERTLKGEHAITPEDPLKYAISVLATLKRPEELKVAYELPPVAEQAPKSARLWFSFFTRDKAKAVAPEQALDQQPKMKK